MSFALALVCSVAEVQAQPFSGTKYNDLNNNGVRDPGEPGLAGWTIIAYLDYSGGTVVTTTTDASGNYSFSALPTGSWTLFEVQQPGWVQTAPHAMVYHVTVPGGVINGLDFGNKEKCSNPSTISLTVGENDNFDTSNGPEFTSPSAELQAAMNLSYSYGSSDQLDNPGIDRVIGHTFTNFLPAGCYVTGARFTIHIRDLDVTDALVFLADGSGVWGATIPQILGPGWSSMTDATIVFDLENLPAHPTTNILAALQDGDFDFFLQDDANIDYATLEVDYCCPTPDDQTIQGTKYHDLNNNGVRDPGEPGLPGWVIQAYSNGSIVTATTDASGNYSFSASSLASGTWTLFEVQQPGWVQTGPHTMVYHVNVPGSSQTGLDFGNKEKCDNPMTESITVGEIDDFNEENGPEFTSPSAELQAAMNISYPYGSSDQLDNPGSNRVIGHTFTNFLPAGCYITGARFTIHIRDLDATDALVFLADGSGVWGATIPDILGPGWSSLTDATIVLDLENLPASPTTNILAALQDGDFDFFLQDDANIDYATLEIEYCCNPSPDLMRINLEGINSKTTPGSQQAIPTQTTTGVGEQNNTFARTPQANPNPFSEHTVLNYELREAAPVRIVIFDSFGNTVYTLDLGTQSAGVHEVRWDGVNTAGTTMATGVYLYRIETRNESMTGQVILQK